MSQFKKIDLKPVPPGPHKVQFLQIFIDFFEILVLGLWEVLNRYEKYDGNFYGNYSAFQNGLIYHFMSWCLIMIENMGGKIEIL